MALAPGSRLGSYEVVARIGAGGMGEVYRARDTTLGRDVALKIIPALFADDPERLARFEREARALAALNHPHIAHIHEMASAAVSVGDAPPAGPIVRALVMEFVDGEDLSERIARGAVPLAEALAIGRQVAGALETAHEAGIIHRDLKPANIKVREDGTVKVLDFGLAKAVQGARGEGAGASEAMNSPTLTARATELGLILGTAAYMAPEQAKGKPVDRRADVWAFGVVVYEMLTGRRAFGGDDVSETLAAVLKETPPLGELPADVPAAIRRLLRRCLEKDRARRLDSMGAARLEIEDAMAGEPAPPVSAPAGLTPARLDRRLVVGAVALAALAAVLAWMLKPAPEAPAPVVGRFAVPLPADVVYTRTSDRVLAISPDGTRVAFIANLQLFVRALDDLEARLVAGVRDPASVFFSPDSQWVGFFQGGRLWKVAVTGGAPVELCTAMGPLGVSWTGDEILFGQDTGIMRVPASGGAPDLVIPAGDAATRLSNPVRLPGQAGILFSRTRAMGNWDDSEIVVVAPGGGAERVILRGGSDARFVGSGHIVYGRAGAILAVGVDPDTLEPLGAPVTLVGGTAAEFLVPASSAGLTGTRHYDVSGSGTLVYVAGGIEEETDLVWADRTGRVEPLGEEVQAQYPHVSPDGRRIAYSAVVAGNRDVYILEWARKARSRLTFDPATDVAPVWTPDGKRIIYASARDGGAQNLYWQPADGTGVAERLTTSPNQQWPYAVTPDGGTVLYIEQGGQTSFDTWAVSLTGDRQPRPLLVTAADERRPTLSPDAKWMAYQSDESGSFEIFVRPFPDVDAGRWQVSAGGGASPVWGPNGREIFFRMGQTIMRVAVSASPVFEPGTPEPLMKTNLMSDAGGMQYGVAPDGKRFVLAQARAGQTQRGQYHVVINWIEELKARVPHPR